MAGVQLRVLPSFPAQVIGQSPIIVTKSGLVYTISFGSLDTLYKGTLTMASASRLRRALQLVGFFQTVDDYILNNFITTSDTSFTWEHSPYHPLPGLVSAAIKVAIPYSDAQLTALWASAFNLVD